MSTAIPRRLLNERLRADFLTFLLMAFREVDPATDLRWSWHIEALAAAVMSTVEDGAVRRLLITIPPRHLKSITISVAFVAWMMGKNPALKFLVASYGNELASELHGQFLKVVE